MESYLKCEDIIKIYPQKSKVKKATLRGIHLSVNEGEIVSILGPSGSGKTTLLYIIAGLLEPSAGSVKIRGHVVNELSSHERLQYYRKNIGMMFQNPQENVVWDFNSYDNVLLPMVLASTPNKREERESRVFKLLTHLNLLENASRKPSQLSGGELQRLGLAITLANNPNLLILDEPTSQLDTINAIKMMNYIQSLCTNSRKTVIMVTHDLRMVKKTDYCFFLKEGNLTDITASIKPN